MNKLTSVVLLIKSLTKGEKRYFKLSSALQVGVKDYLSLFDCIEKHTEIQEIKKLFSEKSPTASFDVTCNYLYKLVLEAMLHARSEKNSTVKLVNGILKVNILFEKGLYQDGYKRLKNIQEYAEKKEMHIIQLWATNVELEYISNLSFHTITETELLKKQIKIQSLLKYSQHVYQHKSLYQLLHHRFVHHGNVRTEQQKSGLNDLLVSEINLMSKPFAETFESKKTHLLFQCYYLITVGDYKSALKTFYELNALFEEHHNLWAESPMDYLITMEGILESLHGIRKYEEMHYFIDKLNNLKIDSDYYHVTCQRISYIFTLIIFLQRGDFKSGEDQVEQYKETLFKKIAFLDISKQAEVFLHTALIYVGVGNMKKAQLYLNNILLESSVFYHLPVYRTFRLINLIVHFELGNHDYIEHETRSFKRGLNENNHKAYLVEKIVLSFIKHLNIVSGKNARLKLWKKIEPKFEKIKDDKYEIQIMKIFNFRLWIESKLCNALFEELLKGNHIKNV